MLERNFQSKLIKELKDMFPGCVITKNDANYIQGFPDLTILYRNKWAVLETKRGQNSSKRPNQEYYVNMLDAMSFSRFIDPENKDRVLDDLEDHFCSEDWEDWE